MVMYMPLYIHSSDIHVMQVGFSVEFSVLVTVSREGYKRFCTLPAKSPCINSNSYNNYAVSDTILKTFSRSHTQSCNHVEMGVPKSTKAGCKDGST